MQKTDIIQEVGRRLGDTSADFQTTLGTIFDHVLRELAAHDCLRSLRKKATFNFVTNQGDYNTQTICGLAGNPYKSGSSTTSNVYPLDVIRLLVPALGLSEGFLERVSEEEFEEWRLAWTDSNGNAVLNQPQVWRLYPNETNLQIQPVPAAAWTSQTVEVLFVAPPQVLGTTADIVEIREEHMPGVLAGMIYHGARFADTTLVDMPRALADFQLMIVRMKAQAQREGGRMRRAAFRDF